MHWDHILVSVSVTYNQYKYISAHKVYTRVLSLPLHCASSPQHFTFNFSKDINILALLQNLLICAVTSHVNCQQLFCRYWVLHQWTFILVHFAQPCISCCLRLNVLFAFLVKMYNWNRREYFTLLLYRLTANFARKFWPWAPEIRYFRTKIWLFWPQIHYFRTMIFDFWGLKSAIFWTKIYGSFWGPVFSDQGHINL